MHNPQILDTTYYLLQSFIPVALHSYLATHLPNHPFLQNKSKLQWLKACYMEIAMSHPFHSRKFEVERPLQFILIEGELSWLGAYLKDHIVNPVDDLSPMLNAVLV